MSIKRTLVIHSLILKKNGSAARRTSPNLFIYKFRQRIILRVVSWRWSHLIFDNLLLCTISIRRAICEDDKLQALFTASRRLTEVNLFSCHFINGSCILNAGLTRLRLLNLTETAVTDLTLAKILQASKELTELHLVGMHISD